MKKVSLWFSLLLFVFILAGCASTPSIEEQFSTRWEKTKAGMTLEEFKQVWPEAQYKGEGKEVDGSVSELYLFTFQPFKYQMAQSEFFAINKGKLAYWGNNKTVTDGKTVLTMEDVKKGKSFFTK